MADNGPGLSARQVLLAAYNVLVRRHKGVKIKLDPRVLAEIADDSDGHRTRKGYLGYDQAAIVRIGSREWALAFGQACGSYPADPYNCDIAAVDISAEKLGKDAVDEIRTKLEINDYFRSSIVHAMADGQLVVARHGRFSQKTLEHLRPRINEFIAQALAHRQDVVHLDLRPVVNSPVRYQKQFVGFLVKTISTAIAES